jgi:thimet oligopeptidase
MSSEAETAATLAASTPDELARAADQAIETARTRIDRCAAGQVSGLALLEEYDEATAALTNLRSVAQLVIRAHPEPAMRTAAEAAEQELDKAATDISLDRDVYEALAAVDLTGADAATRHYVDKTLREFRRSGVDRDEPTRARIRELQEELVQIGQAFHRNIDSDTRSVRVPASALAGLPEDWVRAHPPDGDGQVTVTTDYPDAFPFVAYCRDPAARERLLQVWRQRGHPAKRRGAAQAAGPPVRAGC